MQDKLIFVQVKFIFCIEISYIIAIQTHLFAIKNQIFEKSNSHYSNISIKKCKFEQQKVEFESQKYEFAMQKLNLVCKMANCGLAKVLIYFLIIKFNIRPFLICMLYPNFIPTLKKQHTLNSPTKKSTYLPLK